jgi:nucleoside-diphosphate-sugar epimerase
MWLRGVRDGGDAPRHEMKRALLTGGTGFVGANLARRLLEDGHEVHLLLRPGYQPWRIETIRKHVQCHELRLDDPSTVDNVVRKIQPEWVFHLAAHGAYSWQTDLGQMVLTNIHGTLNLVKSCVQTGFEAFVNAGSSSEYGFKDHPPAETEFLEPNSHYAVTKAAASLFCRYTAQQGNLPLTTLRLYSVYGAYEEPNRLMPMLICHGLKGELPPLTAPETARDYVYIEDAVEAFVLAANRQSARAGAVYNVGTGVQTTLRQVVEVARQVLLIPAQPQWGSMPPRQWDASCWVADNRLISQELGWTPRYSFQEGFRRMVNWYKSNTCVELK